MKFCREWYNDDAACSLARSLPCSLKLLCCALPCCILTAASFLFLGHGSNNILYPKEDRDRHTLFFACRNCEHQVQLGNLYPCSTNKSNPIFLLYPSHQCTTTRMAFGHSSDGVRMSTRLFMGMGLFPTPFQIIGF